MAYPINGGHHHGRRTIIVPPTTDMALVFPLDIKNKRFDRGFYSHYLTDGRASSEQLEYFFKDVEDTFKAKLKWLHRLKAYLVFALLSGILLMTLYSMAVLSGIDEDSYDNYDSYNSQHNSNHKGNKTHGNNFRHHSKSHEYDIDEELDVMFMSWTFLMFAALVWTIIYKLIEKSTVKKARKSIQEVIDRHYAIFASVGLRWNLPLAFPHYIELWKDYKGQNYVQQNSQPTYNNNPLSYNQIHNQLQHQNQNQRYPSLNQVVDHRVCLDYQNNGVSSPLLNHQDQRRDANTYIPPYPIHFVSNAQ